MSGMRMGSFGGRYLLVVLSIIIFHYLNEHPDFIRALTHDDFAAVSSFPDDGVAFQEYNHRYYFL